MSRSRRSAGAVALVLASVAAVGVQTAPANAAPPATIRVGSFTLTSCNVASGAYCGSVERPFDPTGAVPGTITVGFAFVPASDLNAVPKATLLAHEGGPGYATTASASSYVDMYGSLLTTRNLLLIDQRGTGLSSPIDCKKLQRGTADWAVSVKKCGQQLGSTAYLYGTQLVADDEAAIIGGLNVGPVDVYGDSYGTFTSQVFASRHPSIVRSLILDGAYPTYGEDAWYATQGPAMRQSFNAVCNRTPACAALTGNTTGRIGQLLSIIRSTPLTGTAPGGDGVLYSVTLDASMLTYVAFNATYNNVTYRELDAATGAYLDRGDSTPLLRLLAELYYPGGAATSPVSEYSAGEYIAVSCQDYPTLFDLRASVATRNTQYTAAVNARIASNPNTYGPFTIPEYLASDWSEQANCLDWPVPTAATHIGPITPPAGTYPSSIPVLVLNGELDTVTTPAEGAMVASQWPKSQAIVVANSFHVTAMGDIDNCAQQMVRSFVTTPVVPVPTSVSSCAGAVPPVRGAGAYRPSSAAAPPATPTSGGTSSVPRLSAVTTTAETVADAMDRWNQSYEGSGSGLRGGAWTSSGYNTVTLTLTNYRLVSDLAVSGTVTWKRSGNHLATVSLTTTGTNANGIAVSGSPLTGSLSGSWDTRAAGALATMTGTLGGQTVRASLSAP